VSNDQSSEVHVEMQMDLAQRALVEGELALLQSFLPEVLQEILMQSEKEE
jgi:hypothetical protein